MLEAADRPAAAEGPHDVFNKWRGGLAAEAEAEAGVGGHGR